MKNLLLLIIISSISNIGYPQSLSDTIPLLAKGALPIKISSDYLFTEGPAVDKYGNVYFTDQPNDRIMKWHAANGKIEEWLKPSGRANGLFFDTSGDLYACADDNNEIWKIKQDKTHTVIVKNFESKRLNGPNDLWISKKGNIYFTDPFYKRDYWQHSTPELDLQRVYFYNATSNKISIADNDLKQPNGIVGTKDGKILYVADIRDRKTYSYTINKDGALSNKRLFCDMGSDGMTVDSKGNVYLTGRGVTIFDKSGKRIGNIPIAEPWTANVTFGGKDKKTLFITASKTVYTIQMKVKGV